MVEITTILFVAIFLAGLIIAYWIGNRSGSYKTHKTWEEQLPEYRKDAVMRSRSVLSGNFSGPVMINSKLYIISVNGKLFAISPKTGQILEEKKLEKNIYTPPIAIGDKIYLLSKSGTLSVIS